MSKEFDEKEGLDDVATRNAISTTSEKKVLKLIKDEGFELVVE